MTNRHLLELLDDFIDGELKPAETEAVKDHLRNCSSCLKEYEEINQLVNKLKGIESKDPGDDYHRETRELIFSKTINTQQTEDFSDKKLSQSKLTFFKSLGALAASIILLSAALLIEPNDPKTFAADGPNPNNSRQAYETASLKEVMMFELNTDFSQKEKDDLVRAMLIQMPSGILGRAAILFNLEHKHITEPKTKRSTN